MIWRYRILRRYDSYYDDTSFLPQRRFLFFWWIPITINNVVHRCWVSRDAADKIVHESKKFNRRLITIGEVK